MTLFGLVYGSAHRRRTELLHREAAHDTLQKLRVTPILALLTILSAVCTVYLLFMVLQGSYLFSTFSGTLPEGFSYAGYAREGFFQLCSVSFFNLLLVWIVHFMGKRSCREHLGLRALIALLAVLSLLLLATAASKMGLYISVYGLTPLRVLTSAFLLWLCAVFLLVLFWLWKSVSPLRGAVFTAAVLLCLLCAFDLNRGILWYNELHGFSLPVELFH